MARRTQSGGLSSSIVAIGLVVVIVAAAGALVLLTRSEPEPDSAQEQEQVDPFEGLPTEQRPEPKSKR